MQRVKDYFGPGRMGQKDCNLTGGIFHKLPEDLAKTLNKNLQAPELWVSLTPIVRNEFICWIEDAKQAKTRVKRIHRTIEELLEGKRKPCCWPGCIHRTDKKPGKWQ